MTKTAVKEITVKKPTVFIGFLKIAGIIFLALLLLIVILLAVPLITGKFFAGKAPDKKDLTNPYITGGRALVSAHRSGGGIAPENTMKAFKNCIESPNFNVDMFEFDLHITKDEKLILLHDETLDRTTNSAEFFGRSGVKPSEKTYKELYELNFGENFKNKNGEYPYRGLRGENIPKDLRAVLLEEVVDYLESKGGFRYIIEIKDSGENGFKAVDKLYSIIKERGITEKVVFGTFNGDVTKYTDEKHPDMLRSAGIKEALKFYLACGFGIELKDKNIKYKALQIPANQYKVVRLGSERIINYAHRHNIAVQYWTINNPDDVRTLNDMGADCIMSDDPDMAYRIINTGKDFV